MNIIKASDIKKYDNWTCLIYSEPGKGKTSMVQSLKGRTIVLSIDGMYSVLAELPNVTIIEMDSSKPTEELRDFYRWILKNKDDYDNIVIDNLSTFETYWLNEKSSSTKSGMPEIKDYGVLSRIIFDFVASLKGLKKNILIFAHEKKVEITRENGGVYTQHQPDVRNMDRVMGIVPLVGRLVVLTNQETQKQERVIVLQPTQSTRAKDQLIGNLNTIPQMELLPTLQNEGE